MTLNFGPLPADITVDQLVSMNPDINPGKLEEGQTILLPAAKLSVRDKEILDGIGTGGFGSGCA